MADWLVGACVNRKLSTNGGKAALGHGECLL